MPQAIFYINHLILNLLYTNQCFYKICKQCYCTHSLSCTIKIKIHHSVLEKLFFLAEFLQFHYHSQLLGQLSVGPWT